MTYLCGFPATTFLSTEISSSPGRRRPSRSAGVFSIIAPITICTKTINISSADEGEEEETHRNQTFCFLSRLMLLGDGNPSNTLRPDSGRITDSMLLHSLQGVASVWAALTGPLWGCLVWVKRVGSDQRVCMRLKMVSSPSHTSLVTGVRTHSLHRLVSPQDAEAEARLLPQQVHLHLLVLRTWQVQSNNKVFMCERRLSNHQIPFFSKFQETCCNSCWVCFRFVKFIHQNVQSDECYDFVFCNFSK